MKAYLILQKDYDMCHHKYLTTNPMAAEAKLFVLNKEWADEHNPTGYTITDKLGNNTGPYDIEEIEMDKVLD